MIRNKWMWTALVICVCALSVAFSSAKRTADQRTLTKDTAASANTVPSSAAEMKSGAPATKEYKNPFEAKKSIRPQGQSVSDFMAEHKTYTVNETVDLIPELYGQISRDENNPLDVVCNIAQGSTNNSGFLNARSGYEFGAWINPVPSCAGTPDFPYRIDSVRFVVANAGAFGVTGAAGAGTATYRINIYGPSSCGNDSCQNPGNALVSSQTVSFTTTNTASEVVTLGVPVGGCVNNRFYAALEYVSWTGTGDNGGSGGAFRSLWPSLLWSNVARPNCEQWVFNGCSWVDHSTFFTGGTTGFYNMTVYGFSNDPNCTPIACTNEVVCDITCPGGSIQENEPNCANEYVDVTNGGCFAAAENFSNISCGQTVCGASGTFTVGGVNNSDDDFWRFTLTQTSDITLSITGEFCVLGAIFQAGPTGFECDSAVVLGSAIQGPCSTMTLVGRLEAGTYYAYVSTALATGVTCGTPYYMSLQCEAVTCIPDFTASVTCAGASPAISGSTVGAGDPCGIGIPGELWQLNVTQAGSYNFKGCDGPEVYDQFLYLFDQNNCCVVATSADDDLCGDVGGLSYLRCVDLTPGTYFLLVSGFSAADVGAYNIAVTCCQPCPITCTDNEAEGDCADGFIGTNDGCNDTPPTFETIACGDTKCGSYGYYTLNDTVYRDLDWYQIVLTEPTRLTATTTGMLANNLWITTDCPATTISFSTAFECSTHSVSACVPAGTYYILTGPQFDLANAPCNSRYTLSLACEPCTIVNECPATSDFSQPVTLPTDDWTFGVSDVQGDLKRFESFSLAAPNAGVQSITVWAITTQAGNFDPCVENPMTLSIQLWQDSAGVPRLSTGPVCNVTATLAGDPSGLIYLDVYEALAYTYTFPEGQCCTLTNGWISVQGTGVGAPDNCRWLWGSNGTSTGGSSLLYTAGAFDPAETFNLALCVSGCVPCDPITNLTVYNAPGNAGAWLNFTAPQAATYVIYSTTNLNADDNPDNGADPNYVIEGSQFFAAGSAQFSLPVGFANFKKFVVVANCQ